ncbi:MAG: hypothetical protein JOY68_10115 [Candidatus Dormibacteraeota bacterium]|nr:hypothetical protein [Candidatus Dormibacteraeota bacterium]
MDGISDRPWSGITKAAYGTADAYCAACVIDENQPGAPKAKDRCKLPVYEPPSMGGLLNRRGVRAAAARLVRTKGGVEAPQSMKVDAARRLLQLYARLGERPPVTLVTLAGSEHPSLQLGL